MAEAVPCNDNEESREFGGAYINLFVKAETKREALTRAKAHVAGEGWSWVSTEEASPAKREEFDDPDSLECYNEAWTNGISAAFYTWPLHEETVS